MDIPFLRLGEMKVGMKQKIEAIERTGAGRVARISQVGVFTTGAIDLAKLQKQGSGTMAMEMTMGGGIRVDVYLGLLVEGTMEMTGGIDSRVDVGGARQAMHMEFEGSQRMTLTPK